MRPTIPIADWRLATDLTETPALGALIPDPPCGRDCPWCRNWAAAHETLLSADLATSLRRLGVALDRPADLYAYAEPDTPGDDIPHRVTFYMIGRILSGPPAKLDDARFGEVRHYAPIRGAARTLEPGLSVAYARDVGGLDGPWAFRAPEPLLQLDLRVPVPWRLAEARPPVFG